MEDGKKPFLFLPLLLLTMILTQSSAASGDRGTYIIHMDNSAMPTSFSDRHSWYVSTLLSIGSSPSSHLYTYDYVLHGFSAVLSQSQLEKLERMPGHIATFKETSGHFHTTHTREFLGLKRKVGLWPAARFGEGTIIGIIDSGVWPESESFHDKGMPPVPARWRGICESGTQFNSSNCNNKLIGARFFNKGVKQANLTIDTFNDYDSPRDWFGHGTHTSSTAAGSPVSCANYFGYAKGVAMGMAPKAHLAMYKIGFYGLPIFATDVLAGMDQAIADGVDLMSLSLSFGELPFYGDPIALGAFAAMENGIFVACSAGNSGQFGLFNGAPWITTVGAGTVDRDFAGHITFGNGTLSVTGRTGFLENQLVHGVPLYYGHGNKSKELCLFNSLDPADVEGKYVFCDFNSTREISYGAQVFEAIKKGAAGVIVSSNIGLSSFVFDDSSPYVIVTPTDGELVKEYITVNPNNSVVSVNFQKTVLGTKPAPQVAFFSSRGPNPAAPQVLKPDIIAPGYEILAGWVPNKPGGFVGNDTLSTDYIIISGTSMSSPHLVGLAALLRSAHQDWSASAIRSAIMTTADVLDNTKRTITDMATGLGATPLDFGAGQVNPNKATDPGLVYEIEVPDYINFLCGLNYTNQQISMITRRKNFNCKNANLDLNYPSFIAIVNDNETTTYTFKRVLTSVVNASSVYTAKVVADPSMKIVVQPNTISFPGKNSKVEFNLTLTIGQRSQGDFNVTYGFLSWIEVKGTHVVRSPIVASPPFPVGSI